MGEEAASQLPSRLGRPRCSGDQALLRNAWESSFLLWLQSLRFRCSVGALPFAVSQGTGSTAGLSVYSGGEPVGWDPKGVQLLEAPRQHPAP